MNTNSDYQNNLEKEPSDMEQEINSTRARIGRTVEELEQRLSPGQLVDQALGYARDHGGEMASNIASSVRRNPLPMIVTGLGILWLIKSQSSKSSTRHVYSPYDDTAGSYGNGNTAGDGGRLYRGADIDTEGGYYGSSAGTDLYSGTSTGTGVSGSTGSSSGGGLKEKLSGVTDKLSSVGETIKSKVADVRSSATSAGDSMTEKLRSTKDSLTERATGVMGSAQSATRSMRQRVGGTHQSSLQQVRRAKDEFTTLMEEQPLLLGAVGIAIGATIAALVPTTRRERELMGSASDSLADRASELAAEKYEELRETASQTVEEFTKSLRNGGGSEDSEHSGGQGSSGQSSAGKGSSGAGSTSGASVAQGMTKAADKAVGTSSSGAGSSGSTGSVSGSGLSGMGASGSRSTGSGSSGTGSSSPAVGSSGSSSGSSSTGSAGSAGSAGSTGSPGTKTGPGSSSTKSSF